MAKKTPSNRRVMKKGGKPTPSSAFDVRLEVLGLYECGKPASCTSPIFDSGQADQVGWWHGIDRGCHSHDSDEGSAWSALEIALPGPRLIMLAYSLDTEVAATPSNEYYIHDIFWEQTKRRVSRKPAIDGEPKTWRKYNWSRVDHAIRAGIP